MKQHRIEVHGKVEIWTEYKHMQKKKNELCLCNDHDCASDVRLILDKETKENVDKNPGYRSDCKHLGEI